jgi:hypothetical protein
LNESIITAVYLEKCLHLLSPDNFNDEEILSVLLGGTAKINSGYIRPFRRELDRNMLVRKTPGEKKDLVIYYISELMRCQGRMRDFDEIEVQIPDTFVDLNYKNRKSALNNIEQYSLHRHYFFVLLFNEIQKCCFNYKIPFLTICRELWFPLQVIDTEISTGYEEMSTRDSRTEEQQVSTLQKLRSDLKDRDFYKLKLVKELSGPAIEKLIWFINNNELPYQVAMLDFIGFFDYYDKEYGYSRSVIYKKIAEILSVTPRSIRGNYLVLQDYSKEDRNRYTSYKYREQVTKDYQMLK